MDKINWKSAVVTMITVAVNLVFFLKGFFVNNPQLVASLNSLMFAINAQMPKVLEQGQGKDEVK